MIPVLGNVIGALADLPCKLQEERFQVCCISLLIKQWELYDSWTSLVLLELARLSC